MKIFLSWSGDYSRKVAEALSHWLPLVFEDVEVFFSPEIEKGSRSIREISDALSESSVGIVCLDHSNIASPWINFEAGALSKLESSKLYTLLLDIVPSDIDRHSPLSHFQHTNVEKGDFFKIMKSINAGMKHQSSESRLSTVFEKWWSQIESSILSIEKSTKVISEPEISEERKILEEVLAAVRNINVDDIRRLSSKEWHDGVQLEYEHEKLKHLEQAVINQFYSLATPATLKELNDWRLGAGLPILENLTSFRNIYYIDKDFVMPALYGSNLVEVIIAPGVRIFRSRDIGHSTILYMDGFRSENFRM